MVCTLYYHLKKNLRIIFRFPYIENYHYCKTLVKDPTNFEVAKTLLLETYDATIIRMIIEKAMVALNFLECGSVKINEFYKLPLLDH